MSKVLVQFNLRCGNRLSYFAEQWRNHLKSKDMDFMTDVTLVGLEPCGVGYKSVKVHKAVILNLCPVLTNINAEINTNRDEDLIFLFPEDSADTITAFVQFFYEGYFVLKGSEEIQNVLNFMERVGLLLPPGSFHVSPLNPEPVVSTKCDSLVDVNDNVQQEEKFSKKDQVEEQSPSDLHIERQTTRKQSGTRIKAPVKFDPSHDKRTKIKSPSKNSVSLPKEATSYNNSSVKMSPQVKGVKSLGNNHISVIDGQFTVKGPDEKEAADIAELLISGQAKVGTVEGKQVLILFAQNEKTAVVESPSMDQSPAKQQSVSNTLESLQSIPVTFTATADNQRSDGTREKIEYRKTPYKLIGNREKQPKRNLRTKNTWNNSHLFNLPKENGIKPTGKKSKSYNFQRKCMFCDFTSKSMKDLTIHCDLNHKFEIYRCSDCSFEGDCYAKLKFHRYRCKKNGNSAIIEVKPKPEEVVSPIPISSTNTETAEILPDLAPCVKNNKNSRFDINEGEGGNCVDRKLNILEQNEAGKESRDMEILGSNTKSAYPPGPDLSVQEANKPIMKLACPIASCDLKVPIFPNETSSETAQEIIYNHQRLVHNLSESNLSTQVIMDSVVDVYYMDPDSSKSPLKSGNDDFQLQLQSPDFGNDKRSEDFDEGIWENKLRKYWDSCKSDLFKDNENIFSLNPEFVTMTAGNKKEIKIECKIGNLLCVGDGDSAVMAKEDAAYSMLLQLKFIISKNNEESLGKIICS